MTNVDLRYKALELAIRACPDASPATHEADAGVYLRFLIDGPQNPNTTEAIDPNLRYGPAKLDTRCYEGPSNQPASSASGVLFR